MKPLRPHLKRALPPRLVGALAHRRATARAGGRQAAAAVDPALRDRLAPYFADDVGWLRTEFGVDLTRPS